MRPLRRLWSLLIPSRASTQTWMILTFILFVGIAVVAVGLYLLFVVRNDVGLTTQRVLRQEAERIATRIEATPPANRADTVREIAVLTGHHLTVIGPDSLYLDVQATQPVEGLDASTAPEMQAARIDGLGYADRIGPNGQHLYYVAAYRPAAELTIRVGQAESPLLLLVKRMEVILIAGMVMALLLAMLGSWIAAQKVIRPLKAITRSSRIISEGTITEPIAVDSRAAEFQDLAKSLNRMSDSFQEKIDDLEKLARLQNEFIGNVSHEVRNPIFAVGGYLETLGSPTLTDEMRQKYSEKGLKNLERLNNLFNDLIEIARLEYREDLIKENIFDLQELVEEIVETLAPKAHEKGLELATQNPPIFVRADRNRIRQVVMNLIENAIAYTDEGTIRVRLRRRLEKVRMEVVDTGRGIGEEHLENIFQRFYRVDPNRSRKSGGTGLGLSIVKQILQAHGEPIHVESTHGRGTRFWFELPYAEEPVEA